MSKNLLIRAAITKLLRRLSLDELKGVIKFDLHDPDVNIMVPKGDWIMESVLLLLMVLDKESLDVIKTRADRIIIGRNELNEKEEKTDPNRVNVFEGKYNISKDPDKWCEEFYEAANSNKNRPMKNRLFFISVLTGFLSDISSDDIDLSKYKTDDTFLQYDKYEFLVIIVDPLNNRNKETFIKECRKLFDSDVKIGGFEMNLLRRIKEKIQ